MGGGMSLILSGTNGLSDVDGTAATPAIRGTDANTGMFFPAADTIAFAEGGVEAMRLDSAGNVGIGTSSPGYKLEVKGSATDFVGIVSTNTNTAGVATSSALQLGITNSARTVFSGIKAVEAGVDDNATSLVFSTTTSAAILTDRMTLDSSGNLGLGVTPSAWGSYFRVIEGAGASGVALASANVNPVTLAGNCYYVNGVGFKYTSTGAAGLYEAGNVGTHKWYTAPSGTAGNAISFTQAMTLDASGNLLVGATSSGDSPPRAFINGGGTNPALRVSANTSTTSVYAGVFRHESTTSGAYIQFITDNSVETGRIFDSAGTMQYASSSDARLKTNVQPLQKGLSSVLAMNPCTYDMRRGEATTISSAGLIAQEVYETYPYAVGVGGEDENTNPWSVDYGKLTPLLIKAIQEQQAMIEQLKADVAALKGTV
jgi:hypothetical protein